jgi:hypothetical protein
VLLKTRQGAVAESKEGSEREREWDRETFCYLYLGIERLNPHLCSSWLYGAGVWVNLDWGTICAPHGVCWGVGLENPLSISFLYDPRFYNKNFQLLLFLVAWDLNSHLLSRCSIIWAPPALSCAGYFQDSSHELFAQAVFEWRNSWPLPPE